MKSVKNIVFFVLLLFIISACSNSKDIKLSKADAIITNNKDLVGETVRTIGEGKSQTTVDTVLYYTFVVKNNSNKSISNEDLNQIKLKIKPNQELLSVVEDTVGSNIYNVNKSKIGGGQGIEEIPAHGTGKFTIYYNLSTDKQGNKLPSIPTKEELKRIKENALKSTLIVSENGEEIAHLNLNKK